MTTKTVTKTVTKSVRENDPVLAEILNIAEENLSEIEKRAERQGEMSETDRTSLQEDYLCIIEFYSEKEISEHAEKETREYVKEAFSLLLKYSKKS